MKPKEPTLSPSRLSGDTFPPRQRRECSRCGAYCRNEETTCWFCQRKFSDSNSPPLKPGQFSLSNLFTATTIVALALGLFHFSPPLAIVVFLFCAAAVVRMAVVETIRAGNPPRRWSGPVWQLFLVSLAIVFLAAVVVVVSFGFGCTLAAALTSDHGGRPIPDFPVWPIGTGFFLGLFLAGCLLWLTRELPMSD